MIVNSIIVITWRGGTLHNGSRARANFSAGECLPNGLLKLGRQLFSPTVALPRHLAVAADEIQGRVTAHAVALAHVAAGIVEHGVGELLAADPLANRV